MATTLDLNNIQGDILAGLPKKTQTFVFFQINNVGRFRAQLSKLVPLITTTAQVFHDRQKLDEHNAKHAKAEEPKLLELSGVNIAFSHAGLVKIGLQDKIDDAFDAGMRADAKALGDPGTTSGETFDPSWSPEFKKALDGVILLTGDHHKTVDRKLHEVRKIFSVEAGSNTIGEVVTLVGNTRPGKKSGHEHFGFLDGISQPAVAGFDKTPLPGQQTIPPGIILLGHEGDTPPQPRPQWAVDGSFLCFRLLNQLVPEFKEFLKQNAPTIQDPETTGADLLGARLVGRWESGAPIDVTPLRDNRSLGKNPHLNDKFDYSDAAQSQERCPFAAHTRKTNPRADIPQSLLQTRRIVRRGIQFGPEVSEEEAKAHRTRHERGLLFVSYQSVIGNGFRFIQKAWANDPNFPFQKPQVPGFDPLIGQNSDLGPRSMSGTTLGNPEKLLPLTQQWVVPKGGEYFFSPSLKALRDTFAQAPKGEL